MVTKEKSNAQKYRFKKAKITACLAHPRVQARATEKAGETSFSSEALIGSVASIAHVNVHHLALSCALFAADDDAFLEWRGGAGVGRFAFALFAGVCAGAGGAFAAVCLLRC